MRATFWGVRGSVPTPRRDVLKYGGNTTCVQISVGGQDFIIDAGTGIIDLGIRLMARPTNINLLFTHLHHDHTHGFPFFRPAFSRDFSVDIFAGDFFTRHAEDVLEQTMSDPYFPVPLNRLASRKTFHNLHFAAHGDTIHGLFGGTVSAIRLFHPTDGVVAYSFRHGGKKVVFCTDCEHYEGRNELLIPFIEGADLFIHDTMYTDEEYYNERAPKKGWGHSTIEEAVRTAKAAGVKMLVGTHHEPTHSDAFLDDMFERARRDFPALAGAYEGLELEV